jgi:choline dehydrogenase-like flavoprotein
VELNWRKSELDRHTVMTMAKVFGAYLATSNNGRFRFSPWLLNDEPYPPNDELAGNHHMGGTRMGIDPDSAVVDANCKVFGQGNLYVAGSSVFPSGGHANPTFTIVQLALRLGDHLKSRSF